MEKLRIIKLICFIPMLLTVLGCENKLNNNQDLTLFSKDTNQFKVFRKRAELLHLNLWDESNKISMIYLPSQNNSADQNKNKHGIKIGISYAGTIVSKTDVIIVKGELIENGKSIRFDDNGYISHIFTFKCGTLDGEFIDYHPNGICAIKGNFKNGDESGEWQYFDERGKLIQTIKK